MTPLADKITQAFTFKDEAGEQLVFTPGQKEILESILGRRGPNAERRIHVMTHTRYGKSATVGAGVAVRAALKSEKWAIVAGTKEKARIIMDYVINYVLDDPILRSQLDIEISLDRLRRERSSDRLQFARRGEIRIFSADSKNRQELGTSLMGFGAPNVVEDESALIDDDIHSKVMRMLGDDAADNFLVKIGNPFFRNHFLRSFESPRYHKIVIDYRRGLAEGRLTEDFIEEMRDEPNFDIFYECGFPEADAIDTKGWISLLTDEELKRAFVSEGSLWGDKRFGVDIAGGGRNLSTGVLRGENLAKIVLREHERNTLVYASHVVEAVESLEVPGHNIEVDAVGVGRGCAELLQGRIGAHPVNVGSKPSDEKQFVNLRAEVCWRMREWILKGGRLLVQSKRDEDDWLQLANLKYRTILEGKRGKLQIMSKEEMLRNGIESPDIADGLALTFVAAQVPATVSGGVVEPQNERFNPFSSLPELP